MRLFAWVEKCRLRWWFVMALLLAGGPIDCKQNLPKKPSSTEKAATQKPLEMGKEKRKENASSSGMCCCLRGTAAGGIPMVVEPAPAQACTRELRGKCVESSLCSK